MVVFLGDVFPTAIVHKIHRSVPFHENPMSASFEHNLDRYCTVFREPLPNSDDAGARLVEIRFETKMYVSQEKGSDPQFSIFTVFLERADPSLEYCTGKYV
jgi:hypothetical protein